MLSIDQLFAVKQGVNQPINGMRGQLGMIAEEFIKETVKEYATFNQSACQYQLELYDLPDFIQHEFASLLFADNEDLFIEATGPTNPHFNRMQDALLDYLKNTTDKDNQIECLHVWRDGITDYAKSIMEEQLEEGVYHLNLTKNLLKTNSYE
jgi:hypothetical protein